MFTLAERINIAAFRSCIRPELDWSAIPAHLIYDFILWHEIGHKADNYDQIDFFTGKCRQQEDFARLNRALLRANEVLADRYAWAKIFPNEPLPISLARSAEYLAGINADIAELDARVGRRTPPRRMLPCGFAEYISLDVVRSKSYAAIAGVPYRGKPPKYTQEAYDMYRTGPHRPVLELIDGFDSGLFCSVANSAEPKLLVGRSCRKTDLVVAATLGGYSVHELVDFVKGGGVSPRPPRNPWFAKVRRSRASPSTTHTKEA